MNPIILHSSQQTDSTIPRYALVVTHAAVRVREVIAIPIRLFQRDDPMPNACDNFLLHLLFQRQGIFQDRRTCPNVLVRLLQALRQALYIPTGTAPDLLTTTAISSGSLLSGLVFHVALRT